MDLTELDYFVAIAREKNLSRAAESLFVSQPTLTKYLQKIEKETGLVLFERSGKVMNLTYAGRRYLNYAERLRNLKNEMDMELAEILKSNVGLLRIGMPALRGSYILPSVLPEFHKRYPNVKVELMEADSETLDENLRKGKIDLVLYNVSDQKPGIEYEVLRNDFVYAICRKGHPIKEQAIQVDGEEAICLSWLKDEILIVQGPKQRLGQYILKEMKRAHFREDHRMINSNIRAAVSLAAGGYGFAFLSGDLIRHFDPSCQFDVYRLKDCEETIQFCAARREGSYYARYAKDFVELAKSI